MWVTLVRREIVDKAQEAYVALDAVQCTEYETVKQAILWAYELVPEAYRQQFRKGRLKSGQTYVDFARQPEILFDKWLWATETYSFQELKHLMVLEQFKNSLNKHLAVHLNEQDATEIRAEAEMADNYILVHQEPWIADKKLVSPRQFEERVKREIAKPQEFNRAHRDVICHYCKKPGHIKPRCPALQRGRENRSVALVLEGGCRTVDVCDDSKLGAESSVYKSFISEGFVSIAEGELEVPVTLLRDTGAAQSLILKDVIDLPPCTAEETSVLIEGAGGEYRSVPLHRVFLKSSLVTGNVMSSLPVKGVGLLLGNDLAGDQVFSSPIDSSVPCEVPTLVALEKEYPEVFSACAVTRSRSQQLAFGV